MIISPDVIPDCCILSRNSVRSIEKALSDALSYLQVLLLPEKTRSASSNSPSIDSISIAIYDRRGHSWRLSGWSHQPSAVVPFGSLVGAWLMKVSSSSSLRSSWSNLASHMAFLPCLLTTSFTIFLWPYFHTPDVVERGLIVEEVKEEPGTLKRLCAESDIVERWGSDKRPSGIDDRISDSSSATSQRGKDIRKWN